MFSGQLGCRRRPQPTRLHTRMEPVFGIQFSDVSSGTIVARPTEDS